MSSGTAGGFSGGVAQWTLWQLCDSGLPTGGFAHSGGLEAAAANGLVRAKHAGSLLRFVRGVLANAASLQLPLMKEAMRGRTLDDWLKVDAVAHACITAEAARRASLAQGAGLLRAAQAMFPLGDECGGIIGMFRTMVRGGPATSSEAVGGGSTSTASGAPEPQPREQEQDGVGRRNKWVVARGHHAPAFGVVCGALGVGEGQAARAFMFLVARDVLSAATRLSLVGPLEAGRLVSSLSGYVESLVTAASVKAEGLRLGQKENSEAQDEEDEEEQSRGSGGDESHQSDEQELDRWKEWGGKEEVASIVCQVDPVQDIVQGMHDRLYSRMFNS